MIATTRFHDGSVVGTITVIDGVAHADENMTSMVADMNVVNRATGEHLTYTDGEEYVRAFAGMIENGYFAVEIAE